MLRPGTENQRWWQDEHEVYSSTVGCGFRTPVDNLVVQFSSHNGSQTWYHFLAPWTRPKPAYLKDTLKALPMVVVGKHFTFLLIVV